MVFSISQCRARVLLDADDILLMFEGGEVRSQADVEAAYVLSVLKHSTGLRINRQELYVRTVRITTHHMSSEPWQPHQRHPSRKRG